MILTCPDCSTRYSVKRDAVGPNGRTVRCSNCGATWFVASEPDTLALQDNEIESIPAVETADAPSPPADSSHPLKKRPKPALGAHVHVRDKADRQRRNRRLMGVSMIWAVTLGLLVTAGALGYVNRQPMVELFPGTASLFKAVSTPVKIGGLDLEDPATSQTEIDGRATLVINGYIVNRTKQEKAAPDVQLSLLNGNEEEVANWIVEMNAAAIGSQQRIEYISQYPDPPVDAAYLRFEFADETAHRQAVGSAQSGGSQ